MAQNVLDARFQHATSNLADLYNKLSMPLALRKAHHELDLAVDKLYRPQPFVDDRERVEHLLARYEALSAPLLSMTHKKQRRGRKP